MMDKRILLEASTDIEDTINFHNAVLFSFSSFFSFLFGSTFSSTYVPPCSLYVSLLQGFSPILFFPLFRTQTHSLLIDLN